MSKLRLVKFVVQPVVVIDDGENLTDQPMQSFEVSAVDAPTFVAEFLAQLAATEAPTS